VKRRHVGEINASLTATEIKKITSCRQETLYTSHLELDVIGLRRCKEHMIVIRLETVIVACTDVEIA
jgi:hypothetical protein